MMERRGLTFHWVQNSPCMGVGWCLKCELFQRERLTWGGHIQHLIAVTGLN